MNSLKYEANMQPNLQQQGWQMQPLMTAPERQKRLTFWSEHRYRPYRPYREHIHFEDEPGDSDGESVEPDESTTYHP